MYSAQVSRVEWDDEKLIATVAFKDSDGKHPSFNRRIDLTSLTIDQVKGKLAAACTHYESNGDLLIGLRDLIDKGTLITPAPAEQAAGDPALPPAPPAEPPAAPPVESHTDETHDL